MKINLKMLNIQQDIYTKRVRNFWVDCESYLKLMHGSEGDKMYFND